MGGKLFHSIHFLLRKAPLEGKALFGVSVSKKISKRAVVRNTVRRRAYAALRPLVPQIGAGVYLFSAKPGADKVKGAFLAAELAELLKKS